MKKPIFFIMAACAVVACVIFIKKERPSAKKVDDVPAGGEIVDVEAATAQATAKHKADAYGRFMARGGTLHPYFSDSEDGPILNLKAFLDDLGLDYTVKANQIVIMPSVKYSLDEDFMYTIIYNEGMIRGNRTNVGRGAGGWQTTDAYDSATDFIFLVTLDEKTYYIGCDELDVMYKSLRMLTTPADKLAEVEKAIEAELGFADGSTEEFQA